MLSVIIITKDEEADLPGCLESVRSLAAEIVVVDNHSKDRTVEIARAAGAKVLVRDFTGYAPQKQFALEAATKAWVLNIDADERMTPELAEEIRALMNDSAAKAGYEIPFEVHYLGRALRFGGMGSEKHLRLFKREAGRFEGGRVHEGVVVKGEVGRLKGRIQHFPYKDLNEHLEKLERYTTMMAHKRFETGSKMSVLHRLLPLWEFPVRYILKGGFLDGKPGLIYAGMAAYYTWRKYSKLARLG